MNSPEAIRVKSAGSGPHVATRGGGGMAWVAILSPPLPTENLSYFAMFFIVICDLGLFIDVSCSS
jgi:hypothetical protein